MAVLRPARAQDRDGILALYSRLSERSVYLRFHRHLVNAPADEIADESTPDFTDKFTVVAEHEGRLVALGSCERLAQQPERAGLAFVVEDSHQGMGLATAMLRMLAAIAAEQGVRWLEADVLVENGQMMAVFRESGYPLQTTLKFGVVHASFPITEAGD
jgi:GNAT superfamily N-acetyltransferase